MAADPPKPPPDPIQAPSDSEKPAGKAEPKKPAPLSPSTSIAAQRLAEAIAARVTTTRYGLWFENHTRFIPLGKALAIVVRNRETQDWLEFSFGPAIREAVEVVFGYEVEIKWVIDDQALTGQSPGVIPETKEGRLEGTESPPSGPPVEGGSQASDGTGEPQKEAAAADHTRQLDLFGDPIEPAKPKAKRPGPEVETPARPVTSSRSGRRWKSLSDFVVGLSNRVAHASAVSVVEEPGKEVNPLVIHGPVGTGKTHLLEGIYSALKRQRDGRPTYITAEEFTSRFVHASQHNKMASFRRQFRESTALILDDLHFLATRKATQAEFLYTFDALLADGRQVVVSMDVHPRMADDLMPELVDRLLGGAIGSLIPPDLETRLEILRKKSAGIKPPIADAVLRSLANSLRGNVRELEGAINSIRHFARVTERPIDLVLVREALGELLQHSVRVVTIADVDAAVCSALRLNSGALLSKARSWSVTHPRMLAIYLSRKHTGATYGEISKYFGAKTHSSAVAAEKKVKTWLDKNQTVSIGDYTAPAKELIDRIERELQK